MLERLAEGRQRPLRMFARRQILTAVAGSLVIWTTAVHKPAGAEGLLDSLFKRRAADDFLPPEKAFRLRIFPSGTTSLIAVLEPSPGYYLYRDRIQFSVIDSPGVSIRSVTLPKGEAKKDPTFGWTDVFRKTVEVPLELDRTVSARKVKVRAIYQGCEEKRGVCYPPTTVDFILDLPNSS